MMQCTDGLHMNVFSAGLSGDAAILAVNKSACTFAYTAYFPLFHEKHMQEIKSQIKLPCLLLNMLKVGVGVGGANVNMHRTNSNLRWLR